MSCAPSLNVRRYRPSDHVAVWDLHNLALQAVDAHGGNGPWDEDLRSVQDVYLDGPGEFLVGILHEHVVAMGALYKVSGEVGEIRRMRVHPSFQRHGYGTALLSRLEQRARELRCTRLFLETTSRQKGAQAFYEKNGYSRTTDRASGQFRLIRYEKALAP
jgi:GNAT superfamily N-acetyltransferase